MINKTKRRHGNCRKNCPILKILTCNHLYGHKRTWFVFCDRRNHHVWDPEYIDTQDRYISHSFQNPENGETERRQECLKECQIISELTCNRLPARRRILWADQNHHVPLLPNICIHYRPFLRTIHNPEINSSPEYPLWGASKDNPKQHRGHRNKIKYEYLSMFLVM